MLKLIKIVIIVSLIAQANWWINVAITKKSEAQPPKQLAQIVEKKQCDLSCMNFYYEQPQLPVLEEIKGEG